MITTHIIDTWDEWVAFTEYAFNVEEQFLSFDIETNSVVEKTAEVWGIGLSFREDEAFYIPFRKNDATHFWNKEKETTIINDISHILTHKNLIAHNGIYDILVLKSQWGTDFTQYLHTDTILLKHVIDENPPHGLKEVSERFLGKWAVQAQDALYDNIVANGGSITKDNLQMWKADTNILGKYCGWDAALCLRLFNLLIPKLKDEGLESLFYKEEIMPTYKEVVIPMKDNGCTVDIEHFTKLKSDIESDIIKMEKELRKEIAPYVSNFERVEMWKEFGVKRRGKFPICLAEILEIQLPIRNGKPSLIKDLLLRTSVPPTPQAMEFMKWILSEEDDETLPEILHDATSLAHKKMFVEKYPGEEVFNLNSTQHLSWLFFDKLGMTPNDYTETGKPKLDAEMLQELSGQHKFADRILEYKKLQKLLSTYIDGILERQINGTLHTSMLLFGTTSGRFASRNPNLNNLPALKEEGGTLSPLVVKYTNAIRKGMIAPKGYKMIGCDFSSLEPHIAAFASGDSGLIDIFVQNQDFYSAIGIRQFNIKDASPYPSADNYFGKKYKSLRSLVKTYSLAAFYGATAPRISQVTGKSREEAQDLLNGYFNSFPGVKDFIEESHEQALTQGIVRTRLGRVRHLYQAKTMWKRYGNKLLDYKWANGRGLLSERGVLRNLLNNAVNFQIQGYAAHCLNRAMLKMNREFKAKKLDAYIVLSIHDEVLVVAKENIVDNVMQIVKNCMETCVNMGEIKLKATPIVGNSYGECK